MTQLKAQTRNDEKPNKLKNQGLIPAIVYSKGEPGIKLMIKSLDFSKVYNEAGESSLVDLAIDNETKKVLIHDVQVDPVDGTILHIDFYEVDLTKKVTAPVELDFIGEAPAVKNLGGILVKHLNEVEIECLPTDLIKKIEVDVSGLDDFTSTINIKDLSTPSNVIITNNSDDVVANISEPRVEEEKLAASEGDSDAKEGLSGSADANKDSEDKGSGDDKKESDKPKD